jgi:dihydrofolate reductase
MGMRVSMIAAMAANRVIGRDNRLPWRLPADLKRFKALTLGHTLVMGRRTYESIGRPLPGRRTVVITRRQDWHPDGVEVVHSLDEALAAAASDGEVFIAGGGEIFLEALPRTDRIYLTRIEEDVAGDAFFPELDAAAWRTVEREPHDPSDENPYRYSFEILERAGPSAGHRRL